MHIYLRQSKTKQNKTKQKKKQNKTKQKQKNPKQKQKPNFIPDELI